ncbi:hypothetical protein [Glutamicibacter sp. TV12E]|uniref:hypothetical protein n=1 Tax=Glutamicibacter sp. TV12E TaxID=3446362 RepID=UPI004034C204
MSYYDEDYYQEPSEFDEMVGEFKAKLAEAVKEETKSELARLRTENEELRGKVQNLTKLERDAVQAKNKAEMEVGMAKENARQEFRKARAMEILAELTEPRWRLHHKPHQQPKCDQCDNNRYFHYKTPQGRDASERCECFTYTYTWEVEEVAVKEVAKRNGSMLFWYMATRAWEDSRDCDRGEYFSSDVLKPADRASDEEIIDNPSSYGFTDIERCQRIADKLKEAEK